MNEKPRVYFENLDGLRFILAFAVLASHSQLGETLMQLCPFDFIDRIIKLFSTGSVAVSFFFVLSGFLISYLLIDEEQSKDKINIQKFYFRRILRIWPLYFAVLLFSFFVYPFVKSFLGIPNLNPFNIFYQLFFLSNFDSLHVHNLGLIGVAPMMISVNWSIAIEEQFYLVWPILFLLVRSRNFIIVSIIAIIASTGYRIAIGEGASLYYHSLSVLSDFAVGSLFACLTFFNENFIKGIQRLKREYILALYVIGFAWMMYISRWVSGEFEYTIGRIFSTLFFAFIIVEQNFAENSFYKFGNWKFISSSGKYTYAFYLLHAIGLQVSIITFRYLNITRDSDILYALLYAGIAFVVTFSLSILSYRYFESHFLSLRNKFY